MTPDTRAWSVIAAFIAATTWASMAHHTLATFALASMTTALILAWARKKHLEEA